jgi:hypothetical protein
MKKHITTAAAAFALASISPALAAEPGSGLYASDCSDAASGFSIAINSDGTATVQNKGETYDNVLTSYSFFGDNTPSDFLIAIMFDQGASPVPALDGDSWIEIWEGDPDTYALVNGQKNERLDLCPA